MGWGSGVETANSGPNGQAGPAAGTWFAAHNAHSSSSNMPFTGHGGDRSAGGHPRQNQGWDNHFGGRSTEKEFDKWCEERTKASGNKDAASASLQRGAPQQWANPTAKPFMPVPKASD